MTEMIDVVVGCWYQDDAGQVFEVVAADEADESIDIQYFEGEVEELDLDTWQQRRPQQVEAPEDWTGAYDELERDDLGYSDEPAGHANLNNPLNSIEPEWVE